MKSVTKSRTVSRPRVLFVASFAGCPRVWKMASALADNGFDITVLEWDRDGRLPAVERVENVCVRRMKLRASYGLGLVVKLPVWWVYVFLFILISRSAVVQPQNLDNLLPAMIAGRIRKRRIVYDIADAYADAFVPPNMIATRRAVSWLEGTLTGIANEIIIVDESRLRQIRLAKPPKIIYNSPPDIYDELRSAVTTHSASDSRFTIFYAGVLAEERGLDTIVAAVQDLNDVEFVVAGFGAMESKFLDMIKGKRNTKFLGRIPYDDVLKLSYLSDCLIALYDPRVPNVLLASPNKLFEAMMCGKPIIVSNRTNMATIVLRETCGLTVDYGDIGGLKKAIDLLRARKGLAARLGKNGRRAYLEKYSGTLMERKLLRLYSDIAG